MGAVEVHPLGGTTWMGLSVQTTLPNGDPDFEPAVVAVRPAGALLRWSRLGTESADNSTPDQIVDALFRTGSEGNIHVSWLGRFDALRGELGAARWLGEYPDGMEGPAPPTPTPTSTAGPTTTRAGPLPTPPSPLTSRLDPRGVSGARPCPRRRCRPGATPRSPRG